MPLIKFDNAHLFLDKLNIPRLEVYYDHTEILTTDFTEQENAGKIEWREDGVYLNLKGQYQKGFMYIKRPYITRYDKNIDIINDRPRFHLVKCRTIEEQRNNGNFNNRYFWSNEPLISLFDYDTGNEYKEKKLNLCRNCQELIEENINNTEDFHNQLDINDIIIENNESQNTDIYDRPLNWRPISRAYKLEQNYTCEECNFGGNDFYSNYDKRHIHTHHIILNELQNTHRNNLKALCILCHYNQDDHHKSNFEKPRIRKELFSFVKKYKNRLIEIDNKYIKQFVSEYRNELNE
ncbi:MAG: hypothetical protein PSN34_13655 [Urechidicola sp.]|nr:hypothetical protein [Urechidicola sp.]